MLKFNETQAKEFVAELAAKCDKRWKETVDKTRFMNELREGKLRKETIQLFYKNWGSFVPVINSVYTSAFYKHLWFFVKNVDLMEVYTQKVLDEFGHPSPPGHIQILMSTGKALGLSKEEVLLSPMLPECRALPDFHRTLINDGQIQEYWFSVLWEHPVRQLVPGFFQGVDHALRPLDRRRELFFQTPRSGYDGPFGSQSPRRGNPGSPGETVARRRQRTAGLFG